MARSRNQKGSILISRSQSLAVIQREQDRLPVSVVICTHNPRSDYLQRCLVALDRQTLSKDFWELIIVDNASTPEMAPPKALAWHPRARFVSEPKLGLTPARLCGIRAAQGEL